MSKTNCCSSVLSSSIRSIFSPQTRPTPCSRSFSSTPTSSVWVQKKIDVKLRVDHPKYGKNGKVIRVKPGHMRQQLYPSGLALYCAKDGIPIHHFQPTPEPSSSSSIPPPGLSRPVAELIKRLGVKMSISNAELSLAQAQIDRWKQSANPQIIPPKSENPSPPLPPSSHPDRPIPKGLLEHLQSWNSSQQSSDRKPLFLLQRPGPDNSESLYSSIKTDEIIEQLVVRLEDDGFLRSDLINCLNVVGCRPKTESGLHSTQVKPIKSTGYYDISLAVSSAGAKSEDPVVTFTIRVQK